MDLRRQFVDLAMSWQGTPFHHKGRLPHVGLDCVGLPLCAAWEMGLPFKDNLGYGHDPSSAFLRNMITGVNQLIACPLDAPELGDLILMRYTALPTHVAIDTLEGIVHAYAPSHKVVYMPWNDSIKNLVVGRYRYKWPS